MKAAMSIALVMFGLTSKAQLDLPVRIVLDGPSDADRQITGLATPTQLDAAVSLEAARATTMSYAPVAGTTELLGDLTPAPTSYSVGMMVTLMPSSSNDGPCTLDLNGLGARPIIKFGALPLDSADIRAGVPVRSVYDGNSFLLLNDNAYPCKTGYTAYSNSTCIQDSSHTGLTFYQAVAMCEASGARLCTLVEWANACRVHPGFIGSVSDYEWIDDGANNQNDVKTVGAGWSTETPVEGFACNLGFSRLPTLVHRFRCCTSR